MNLILAAMFLVSVGQDGVRGRVSWPDGTPVISPRIELSPEHGGERVLAIDGILRLEGLDPNTQYFITVWKDGSKASSELLDGFELVLSKVAGDEKLIVDVLDEDSLVLPMVGLRLLSRTGARRGDAPIGLDEYDEGGVFRAIFENLRGGREYYLKVTRKDGYSEVFGPLLASEDIVHSIAVRELGNLEIQSTENRRTRVSIWSPRVSRTDSVGGVRPVHVADIKGYWGTKLPEGRYWLVAEGIGVDYVDVLGSDVVLHELRDRRGVGTLQVDVVDNNGVPYTGEAWVCLERVDPFRQRGGRQFKCKYELDSSATKEARVLSGIEPGVYYAKANTSLNSGPGELVCVHGGLDAELVLSVDW